MNTIKLYKNGEVKLARVTQTHSYGFYKAGQVRNVPYVREVLAWAAKNGWSRKKPRVAS